MDFSGSRFRLGAFECLAINDGIALYEVRGFFANAPKAELAAALAPYPVEADSLQTPFHCLVIRSGAQVVLVDTGLGQDGGSSAGHLLTRLAAEGIAPGDVSLVIVSHAHADHLGGTLDASGRPAFPRARYVISRSEWDFWQSEAALAQVPEGAVTTTREIFSHLRPCLEWIDPPVELLPGIEAIPLPGHTPGQIGVRLVSGDQRLIYTADALAHPLHLAHPEWNIISDLDRAQATRTRRELLNDAVIEQSIIYGYHFTRPGPWRVRVSGSGWEIYDDGLTANSPGDRG